MNTFSTRVDDQACLCRVTHYKPYEPARGMHGAMEDAEEAIPSEFDFEILTLDHQPNPSLDARAHSYSKIVDRLQDEYEASVLANKHGIDF